MYKRQGVFITTTGDAPGTNRLEVTLEWGKLICEHDKLIRYQLDESERKFCVTCPQGFDQPKCTVSEEETDGENPQHVGVLRAFAGNILHGTPLVARGEEGINGLTLSNAMHLSDWLGETVELPFDEELFLEKLNERDVYKRQWWRRSARWFPRGPPWSHRRSPSARPPKPQYP